MKVKELLEYLKELPKDADIVFTDVCCNWEFQLYQVEYEKIINTAIIVGDEE